MKIDLRGIHFRFEIAMETSRVFRWRTTRV